VVVTMAQEEQEVRDYMGLAHVLNQPRDHLHRAINAAKGSPAVVVGVTAVGVCARMESM
jgi:hypothetical protein